MRRYRGRRIRFRNNIYGRKQSTARAPDKTRCGVLVTFTADITDDPKPETVTGRRPQQPQLSTVSNGDNNEFGPLKYKR